MNTKPVISQWRAYVERFAQIVTDKVMQRSGLRIKHLRSDLLTEAESALNTWVRSRDARASRLGFPRLTGFYALAGMEPSDWPPSLWDSAVRALLVRAALLTEGEPDRSVFVHATQAECDAVLARPHVPLARGPVTSGTWRFHLLFVNRSATGKIDREFQVHWVHARCDLLTALRNARPKSGARYAQTSALWRTFIAKLRRFGVMSVYGSTALVRSRASAVLMRMTRRLTALRGWLNIHSRRTAARRVASLERARREESRRLQRAAQHARKYLATASAPRAVQLVTA